MSGYEPGGFYAQFIEEFAQARSTDLSGKNTPGDILRAQSAHTGQGDVRSYSINIIEIINN